MNALQHRKVGGTLSAKQKKPATNGGNGCRLGAAAMGVVTALLTNTKHTRSNKSISASYTNSDQHHVGKVPEKIKKSFYFSMSHFLRQRDSSSGAISYRFIIKW